MKRKWLYAMLLTCLAGVFGFAAYKLFSSMNEYKKAADVYDDLKSLVKVDDTNDEINSVQEPSLDVTSTSIAFNLPTIPDYQPINLSEQPVDIETESVQQTDSQPTPQVSIPRLDWEKLREINGDINSWIYQPNTKIDYPVVQTTNNDEYLRKNIYKQIIGGGSIFMDYRIKEPYQQFVTIIYGHRQVDRSMFGSFAYYDWNPGYVYTQPYIYIYTPEQAYYAEIVAVLNVRYTDSILYQCEFEDDIQKQQYIDRINTLNRCSKQTNISVDDSLLVLSTCDSNGGKNGGRILLIGVLHPIK